MKRQVTALEAKKSRLLGHNGDLESRFITKENDYKREIHGLTVPLDEEKKQIEAWWPQVELAVKKLEHLLPMCNEHAKSCSVTSMKSLMMKLVTLN